MYALFVSGSDDADIPNWQENKEKYDAEIVALGERIIKYCPDAEIRYEATNRLAFHHCEMGRKSIGRSIYETLPSIYNCKEMAIRWALSEEEELPYTREYILKAYGVLSDALWRLMHLVPNEDAIKVIEKMYALDHFIYDDIYPNVAWWRTKGPYLYAKYCMRLNRINEAIEQLKISAQAAVEFDNRPEETKTNSFLLGERIYKRTDFDTADSRPLREILRDSWLSEKEFDAIRNTDEFKAILDKLN